MIKVNKKVLTVLLTFFICFACFKVKANDDLNLAQNSVSAILMEESTGKIIYEKNSKERRAPASMTKIMTMILVMEAIEDNLFDYDTELTASENATKMGGTQIYLEIGEKMSVNDLLKAVAITSANDATVVFAEAISGSVEAFVTRMNEKGKELKLENTNFINTNGLPANNHYSCSYDMALMSKYLLNNYKDSILNYTNIYEDYLRKGTEDEFWLVNTNKLIRFYKEVDGLKTGWTEEAGYCLSATMSKNGIRFIAVSMGCETSAKRNNDVMNMLNYGVNNYEIIKILNEDEVIDTKNNILLNPSEYKLIVKNDVTIIVKKGEKLGKITTKVKLDNPLDKVGYIEVYLDNVLYNKVELKTDIKVTKASFFKVFKDIFIDIFL